MPPLRRFWYLQQVVPKLVRQGRFDILFAVAEVSSVTGSCPMVTLVRNPNFYAEYNSVQERRRRAFQLMYELAWRPWVLLTLRRADRALFVSESFRAEVLRKLPLDLSKTGVLYHGLSPTFAAASDSRSPFDGAPYIVSVSSVISHKNYETLLEGFARLIGTPRADDRLYLVIAGVLADPAYHAMLLARAEALGIRDRVRFLGKVPYEELPMLYRGASGFVLASRLETFGHPLVEAMASGTPVIASNLAVCREICQDGALFFDPDDTTALAEHLRAILSHAGLRDALVQAGLRRARAFSWKRTAERLSRVLEEVVAEEHARVRDRGRR
jgi:glycosyltransferase involved in cell wall biosynthesis